MWFDPADGSWRKSTVCGLNRSAPSRGKPRVESRSGAVTESSVSRSRSSNRTCGSPASGFRTRVLLSLCPRQVGLKVGQPDYPQLLIKIGVGEGFLDSYP